MPRWLILLVTAALLALAPEARAFTDDVEKPAAKADAHDKDIFGASLDLAIWTLVVFLILVFILSKFAWKPIVLALQQREASIAEAIEASRRAKEEAEQLRMQFRAEAAQAADKVRAMMDEARRDAQHTADETLAKARTEIQAERERLRREVETARDQAIQAIAERTAQLATLVSARAIGSKLNIDDHRGLVDEAIASLDGAVKSRKALTGGRA